MPESNGSLAAVIVSGGKQYRVAPGDTILVDRVAGEPGSELALARVLLLTDGDAVKAAPAELAGVTIGARVVAHRQGPKIDVLRYKSKKRVRVHRGARAQLTALEILDWSKPTTKKKDAARGDEAEAPSSTRRRKKAASEEKSAGGA